MDLSRKRARLDFEEGRWLLAAKRVEAHRQLGYGSFTEYVERLFGYAPRVTHDKLRVAAALEALPGLSQELREGGLSFSHVRELTRVAIPETESAWIEHARGCTSRQVERRFRVMDRAHCRTRRVSPSSCGTSFVSRFRVRRSRPFARRWPSSGAKPASISTMTRPCCSWPVTCSVGRPTTGAPAIRWRSTFVKTAGEPGNTLTASSSRCAHCHCDG
jgi:hypothetical protein